MRVIITLIAFFLLDSCSCGRHIDVVSIRIISFNQHPTLVDHDRKLVTIDKNGKIIDNLKIYPDTGNGCNSYLFDTTDKYVLIDCNGQWYSIGKRTGLIRNEGWKWLEALPTVQLGAFRRIYNEVNYKLLTETKATLIDVYKYKDSND
jgi:hypothetical protein